MDHDNSDLLGQVSMAQENNEILSMDRDHTDLLGQVSMARGQFVPRYAKPAPDGPRARSGKRAAESGIGPELASTHAGKHAPGSYCGCLALAGNLAISVKMMGIVTMAH
jgi:hypothetical protein